MIRGKLDYGALILTTIPKTKLKKLEKTQNQILRGILGCLKSTPTQLIQIETGILPIKDRWDMLATRYLTNLSTKTWNSAYPSLYEMAKKKKIWKPRSTPGMSKYLTELNGESSPLILQEPAYQPYTEPLAPWQLFQITTGYLTTNKKEAVKNKALTAATFLETKSNEDQNHLDIYTDGSTFKTTKKTTCAVYIPATQTKETWLLSNFTNSFNAELAAIKQALTLTYNQDWPEITIYTDSKSAIHAISNFKWKSSNYIPEIIQQINNYKSA
jgi:hypothetical protein